MFPLSLFDFRFEPFKGLLNGLKISGLDCVQGIYQVQSPLNIRNQRRFFLKDFVCAAAQQRQKQQNENGR